MWKFTLLFILSPLFTCAQSYATHEVGKDGMDNVSITASYGTQWQTLLRPTVHNPVTAFYRFSYNDGSYRLELKLSAGGVQFVVAKNAVLELAPEECQTISLYNEQYQSTCKGCGSRAADASVPGVTLSFPLDKKYVDELIDNYLYHIRLHLADFELGGTISLKRSETFQHELEMFRHSIEHKG